jgi:hypothetical protein
MNTQAFRPAVETLGPLTLTGRDRFDGPWLGIRHGRSAEASEVVLVGDPRSPRHWRRIDASQPVQIGTLDQCAVTPLALFGISCTMYSHSRVLSVWKTGERTRARQYGHPAGGIWEWAGPRVDRIKIERGMLDLVTIAAKNCNAEVRGKL